MQTGSAGARRGEWTPDTRFGLWFQGTAIWRRYVVDLALDEFDRLLGGSQRGVPLLLDAGCGSGSALGAVGLRFRPGRILAVDIDAGQLARAREEAARCACAVEVRRADLRQLELESESVDLVWCHQVLHHVADAGAVLGELFRVLRPGGVLLLAESCRSFTRSLPVRLLFRHPPGQRSAADWLALLRESGFAFDGSRTSMPDPFWSRPDFGLRERLGWRVAAPKEPKEVQVVARRPAHGAIEVARA